MRNVSFEELKYYEKEFEKLLAKSLKDSNNVNLIFIRDAAKKKFIDAAKIYYNNQNLKYSEIMELFNKELEKSEKNVGKIL